MSQVLCDDRGERKAPNENRAADRRHSDGRNAHGKGRDHRQGHGQERQGAAEAQKSPCRSRQEARRRAQAPSSTATTRPQARIGRRLFRQPRHRLAADRRAAQDDGDPVGQPGPRGGHRPGRDRRGRPAPGRPARGPVARPVP
ncbi:hypothetical protein DMC25_04130, partial [Caulobacter sp. D4A]